MSFPYMSKNLRSGNTNDLSARLEMSAYRGEAMEGTATDMNEQNDESSARFSPDMIVERIKANLEPLHAQISALMEMMDRLFQSNSAREFTTASTREQRPGSESLFVESPGTSRFPSVAQLTTAGYSPDI